SEVLTSKHHIIYVLENGVGFYGHARRIIVLKDYIIERLNRVCFNKMNTVKRMLKYINSYEDLKDTIDYINTLTIDYDISFKLFKNSKDAGLK
ncbi:MAG: hypothetical protein IJA65_00145, partial [Acholeplasmatales bacterium]|nr:hypothetical protein [Acholeplasmatales bacterium]